VIVLDDLQWADLDTVELLRAIAQRHSTLRTIVLGAYTPFVTTLTAAALRTLTGELRAGSHASAMSLTPISEDQVRRYLISRFSTPSVAALARMIRRVSSGNPLLMVSMTDALVAEGLIVLGSDGWCLRYAARTIERSLPATTVESLLWRFDQLEAEDRAVLENAAAVGLDFCALDVAKAAGVESARSILRRMELLCDRGFIARRARKGQTQTSTGDVYRFIHPLHAQVLAGHAPVFDQLRAAERLAAGHITGQRFG
jgi:predicted ATPase